MSEFVFSTDLPAPIVNPGDYLIDQTVLQQGGWGTVHKATHIRDYRRVAMKFFGYAKNPPVISEIKKEIDLMIRLQDVPGVVKLEGVFDDTDDGLVPEKALDFRYPYPVIVMELVAGGDLYDRIQGLKTVSENYLARLFRSAMEALQGIHSRGFIHRDLKPENMVLASRDNDSIVKIIDFGLMIEIPTGDTQVTDREARGTPGFFAPESLTSCQYSFKSDVWQAGCILYSMLSGQPAFNPDPKYASTLIAGRFFAMVGSNWDLISDSAKDLVRQMLKTSPAERISMEDLLKHPWLTGSAPLTDLGPEYIRSVRALTIRRTINKIFKGRDVEGHHRERRTLLDNQLRTATEREASVPGTSSSFRGIEIGPKLKHLKHVLLSILGVEGDVVGVPPALRAASSARSSSSVSSEEDLKLLKGNIDFDSYCAMMRSVDLEAMATTEVFNIFDIDNDGKIDLKEFFFTLLSFRSTDDVDAATLYFNLFDVNEDGYISLDEMRAVVACLLHDSTTSSVVPYGVAIPMPSVEEMFNTMDNDPKDGRVDLREFKKFYDTVLLPNMSRSIGAKSTGL